MSIVPARGKRPRVSELINARAQLRRGNEQTPLNPPPETTQVARDKRDRAEFDQLPDNLAIGGTRQGKRRSGVGFVTKDGKVVSFQKKGVRKAKLAAKIRAGLAQCKVNPNTGRASREGTRTFKKLKKAGV